MDHTIRCKMYRLLVITFLLTAEIVLMTAGCATLPKNFDRPKSYAFAHTENSALGRAIAVKKAANPGLSGFHLLGNGLDAFVARAVLSRFAERSIDVQYFIYHDDLVGRLFTDLLTSAADRGVRVRLLVDDIHFGGRDFGAVAMDMHPNIQVRVFNPFSRNVGRILQFVTRLGSVTRRMHNKTFTVDNQFTILGGRNIGNEYFEADPDLEFQDLDVMAIGPVVKEVSSVFDRYWNSELAYPVPELFKGKPPTAEAAKNLRKKLNEYVADQADSEYLRALRNSDLAHKFRLDQVEFGWGDAEVVYDRPEKLLHDSRQTQYHLSPMLTPYFEGVKKELIIFSPYFVPGKSGTAFLTQLAKRGVRVRILTNSLASNDVGIVHAGYMKYRKKLLRGGVELYELNKKLSRKARQKKKGTEGASKASLHAKSFVFDRQQIFIGSLNLDPVALQNNTEIGVVLKVPEIAEEMAKWFDENINQLAFRLELKKDKNGNENIIWHGIVDGKEQSFNVEPYAGFWRRLGINILSIFPIESQL
jgi:putative cardiolipin synthase